MRAEILSSESLALVSRDADLLFRSLILIADDYGRLDGRIPVIRGAVFPLRPEVTDKKVERWLAELVSIPDPPVRQYSVDGRTYLALTGWERHRGKSKRASDSKYPSPPEECETQYNASPEIRGKYGDPPEGMESRVWSRGMESREISGVSPDPSLSKPKERLCPDRLEASERESLLAWAATRSFTESQVRFAWNAVKDWSRSKNEKRTDWLAATRNAMRLGWALKGYVETDEERYERELAGSPLRAVPGGLSDAS